MYGSDVQKVECSLKHRVEINEYKTKCGRGKTEQLLEESIWRRPKQLRLYLFCVESDGPVVMTFAQISWSKFLGHC